MKLKKDLKELASLEPTYITIEQWSFLKILHKNIENRVLFKLISNYSKEYIQELSLSVTNEDIDPKSNTKQQKYMDRAKNTNTHPKLKKQHEKKNIVNKPSKLMMR
jgi:hemerythrin-like domain-containing protein